MCVMENTTHSALSEVVVRCRVKRNPSLDKEAPNMAVAWQQIEQGMERDIVRTLVEELRDVDAVRQLFYRQHRALNEFWLVTVMLDDEDELVLYSLAGFLRQRFPDSDVDIHIEHVGFWDVDPAKWRFVPPTGAEELLLH